MAYLENMPKTCRDRGTNPHWPVDLLDAITGEFDKAFQGGIFDPSYVLDKLDKIRSHVVWLDQMANEEFAKQCEPQSD